VADDTFDVLVVGCGPVGALLAVLLGLRGVQVLVVERAVAPAAEPRAIATDDEVLRILLRLPGGADLITGMDLLQRVTFTDAHGRRLTGLGLGEGALRLPRLAFFDQPVVEAALLRMLADAPAVRVETGTELLALAQDHTGTTATLRARGTTRQVRASWLVGADGARSTVRGLVGVPFPGRAGSARWLVVDVDTDAPLAGLPHMRFVCDPAGPWLSLPRPGGHRVERALPAGIGDAEATAAGQVRALLSRVLDPALLDRGEVRVRRAAVYDYAARQAQRWRVGRVLLVGDAAHTMPPFAGQGLSAGLRDADALAWRLELAVRGLAGMPALDAWERERRAHVTAMTRLSLFVGGIVETADPCLAGVRDAVLRGLDTAPVVRGWWRGGGPKPPARIPRAGMRDLLPQRSAGAGLLLPRPRVRDAGGRLQDLDTVLGECHALLMTGPAEAADVLHALPPELADALRQVGFRLLRVVPPGGRPVAAVAGGLLPESSALWGTAVAGGTAVAAGVPTVVEDVDGTVLRQLGRLERRLRLRPPGRGPARGQGPAAGAGPAATLVALVRPDRHLAGAVLLPDLPAALAAYLAELGAPETPPPRTPAPRADVPATPAPVRVLLLCGSLRAGSVNAAALRTLALAPPPGVATDLYDGLAALPPFDPDVDTAADRGQALPAAVTDLRARIAAADAVLVCTPEYAGALPGALKTLLEWTIGDGGLAGKPVGWINCSTAPTNAADAHASLRTVLRYAGARLVEAAAVDVGVPRAAVAGGVVVVEEDLRARLLQVLAALAGAAATAAVTDSGATSGAGPRG